MKATIDIPDHLYRRVKAKSALERCTVREVATALFQEWVDGAIQIDRPGETRDGSADTIPVPAWYGSLNKYVAQTRGRDDMESIRLSIGRALGEEHGS